MFDWSNYLGLADKLSQNADEESKRSAISRAYYSSFHKAKEHLAAKGIKPTKKESVHAFVWNGLNKLSRDERVISLKGDRLRVKRTKVDYDKKVDSLSKLTTAALIEAKEINELIDKLNN